MSTPRQSDDEQLRALLSSLGIGQKDSIPDDLNDVEIERAERMLAQIVAQPQDTRLTATPATSSPGRRWKPRWTLNLAASGVICALLSLVVIIHPWGRPPTASAQTPPLLQFADVRSGLIKSSGEPSGDLLKQLSAEARALPEPADLPVQHLELDGWWASSTPSGDAAPVLTVLSPVRSDAYLLPNNDRRAIERRGRPLDADGRPVDTDSDWAAIPAVSDTITALDSERDADYPRALPESTSDLREALAPSEDCSTARGGCLLSSVSSLFENYVISPDLSSRLWRVLAAEPTITSLGRTTDRKGREAVAFTARAIAPSEQVLLLIDPKSGQYLGSEHLLVAPDASIGFEPPAVIAFTYLVKAERIAASDVPDSSTSRRH